VLNGLRSFYKRKVLSTSRPKEKGREHTSLAEGWNGGGNDQLGDGKVHSFEKRRTKPKKYVLNPCEIYSKAGNEVVEGRGGGKLRVLFLSGERSGAQSHTLKKYTLLSGPGRGMNIQMTGTKD